MTASPMHLAHPGTRQRFKRWMWEWVFLILTNLLYRIDERGKERLPHEGPVLLYYNHIHYADPFVLLTRLKGVRYAVPVGKREILDEPIIGKMADWYGAIFVSRGEADLVALHACLVVLDAGHVVVVAPEGTRSKTGGLMQGQRGLGFLARRTHAVMQPVAIWGTPDFPSANKRGHRALAHVHFGRPYRVELPATMNRKASESAVTEFAMQELAALLPEHLRGVYSPAPSTPEWVRYV